jgi:hypothetical protein
MKFPPPLGFTKHINSLGGVVSWDVPIEKDGRIPDPFLDQLRAVGNATGTLNQETERI